MKPWQRGYALDELLALEARYTDYNAHTQSPFSMMKKNRIADRLHDETLQVGDTWSYVQTLAKVRTSMYLFPDVEFAVRQRGDRVLTHLAVDWSGMTWAEEWERLLSDPIPLWIQVWADDAVANDAVNARAQRVGTKVTTFGDVFAWYFRGTPQDTADRVREIEPANMYGIGRMLVGPPEPWLTKIAYHVPTLSAAVDALPLSFADHYSKYNVGQAWSALSLRGYSPDVTMIEKPAAMNDAWREKHASDVFALQDTELRRQLPAVEPIIQMFGEDVMWDRIRLMRLAPGGGELQRHTDQVDRTMGVGLGKIMRIHIPLKTNPDVLFTVWNANGAPVVRHMAYLKVWLLDTRWPHRAVNGGTDERIHLVLDAVTTPALQNMLAPSKQV
jgi:hypothetical protein